MDEQCSFSLGYLVITQNAFSKLTLEDILPALKRYCSKDWGEVCEEDWQENDHALEQSNRLLASYKGANNTIFWIITEWDRSYTTILLPEDY